MVTTPPWLVPGFTVAAGALVAGLGPLPLVASLAPQKGGAVPRVELPFAALAAGAGGFAIGADMGWWTAAALGVAAACLAAMALIDLRRLVIPDLHVLMLGALTLASPFLATWKTAALGALIGGGLLFGVRALFRYRTGVEALGLGDVKLMVALGALCGPVKVLWVIIAASVMGTLIGLIRNRGRIAGAAPLPFGTLAAGPALGALVLTVTSGPT